jgi:hypothetical protein
MNANELAKLLEVDSWRQQAEQIENLKQWERRHLDVIEKQQAEIEALKKDNKELHAIAQRMAMAESDARKSLQWFKDAKEMNNEPVAWRCKKFYETQEGWFYNENKIGEPLYTHPVKELTKEDRLKLIGTLKWAEDLLREAGHDEAVSDAQDCLMILRKASEK